jgi:hypothetical protein
LCLACLPYPNLLTTIAFLTAAAAFFAISSGGMRAMDSACILSIDQHPRTISISLDLSPPHLCSFAHDLPLAFLFRSNLFSLICCSLAGQQSYLHTLLISSFSVSRLGNTPGLESTRNKSFYLYSHTPPLLPFVFTSVMCHGFLSCAILRVQVPLYNCFNLILLIAFFLFHSCFFVLLPFRDDFLFLPGSLEISHRLCILALAPASHRYTKSKKISYSPWIR